jgi:predicted regulator of Ras-like GTPase activity (Roadblock/LC7/MglB family)
MNDLILYPENIVRLNSILTEYVKKSRVSCTLITSKDGQLVTYQGLTEAMDTLSIAALVAGSFSATLVIATIIGETEFDCLYQRGKHKHIHIALIDDNSYLTTIFYPPVTLDQIADHATACCGELAAYFGTMGENVSKACLPALEMPNLLGPSAAEGQKTAPSFMPRQGSAPLPAKAAEDRNALFDQETKVIAFPLHRSQRQVTKDLKTAVRAMAKAQGVA